VTGRLHSAEELFIAHAAFVAGFAHRLGVRNAEIDDVVQEVFMVVHRKGGFVDDTASPRTWLGAITLLQCRNRRRSAARKREDYDEIAIQHAVAQGHGASPAHAAEIAESLVNVQSALDTLDFDHRSVFVLYEIEGEPCTAIAQALEIPVGTVYSRLHHARQRFADAYERQSTRSPHGIDTANLVRSS